MKKFFYLFYLITTVLTLLGCGQSGNKDQQEQKQSTTDTVPEVKVNQLQSQIHPDNFFTESDAEKILGEQAHLTDSSSTIKEDTLEYKCTYTANSKDQKTGKTGVVYFLFEQYAEVSIAKEVYSSIRKANENHEGFKVLHDMGDEAYFHSDGQNFYFILVRKGEKMLRMKVNKTTSTTSLDEFNLIAKNITAAI
jgi:predicted small lipoprotein YifL